jgi:hypothetical protein
MNIKLVFRLSVLILGLLLVIMFRQTMGSKTLTESLNAMFGGTKPANVINWCADHVVDVVWLSEEVPEKLKSLDLSDLRETYCELKTEPIIGVELNTVTWAKLAESSGAAGQKTTLEWNKALNLFRAGGMPFKSSEFGQELSP